MLLLAVTASHFPCFCWPWRFWGILVRCFTECLTIRICLMFFPLSTGVTSFGVQDHRDEVPFSSQNITGTYYEYYLSLMVLTLIISVSLCLSGFFTVKLLFFPPFIAAFFFHTSFFWCCYICLSFLTLLFSVLLNSFVNKYKLIVILI